jgi:hypothetical protein
VRGDRLRDPAPAPGHQPLPALPPPPAPRRRTQADDMADALRRRPLRAEAARGRPVAAATGVGPPRRLGAPHVPTTAETLARPPLSSRLRGTGAPAERCHAPPRTDRGPRPRRRRRAAGTPGSPAPPPQGCPELR